MSRHTVKACLPVAVTVTWQQCMGLATAPALHGSCMGRTGDPGTRWHCGTVMRHAMMAHLMCDSTRASLIGSLHSHSTAQALGDGLMHWVWHIAWTVACAGGLRACDAVRSHAPQRSPRWFTCPEPAVREQLPCHNAVADIQACMDKLDGSSDFPCTVVQHGL